jgi:NAD(P)-dependent dehydrogenase (short-subunit alcohol dehydrogenase family)
LAVEVTLHGITINCLYPGMTWMDRLQESAKKRALNLDAMVEMIPDGRMAFEEDHARKVAFFASAEAGYITGQVVAIDDDQNLYYPLQMTGVN